MLGFLPDSINLPWFIWVHSIFFLLLGLYLLYQAPEPGKPLGNTPMLGIATTAIGLAYLFLAYMPIEQNQWLHASVPIRIILGILLISRVLIGRGLSGEEKLKMLILGLYDGFGGIVLGLWLGKWDGKVAL